jgi:hypothetical protein
VSARSRSPTNTGKKELLEFLKKFTWQTSPIDFLLQNNPLDTALILDYSTNQGVSGNVGSPESYHGDHGGWRG